jgi:hypothetical protein
MLQLRVDVLRLIVSVVIVRHVIDAYANAEGAQTAIWTS